MQLLAGRRQADQVEIDAAQQHGCAASGRGVSPRSSCSAARKASIGLRTQAAFLTDGTDRPPHGSKASATADMLGRRSPILFARSNSTDGQLAFRYPRGCGRQDFEKVGNAVAVAVLVEDGAKTSDDNASPSLFFTVLRMACSRARTHYVRNRPWWAARLGGRFDRYSSGAQELAE